MSLISLSNVSFGYNDNVLLNGVSIAFNDNEHVAIIGDNGCGKTTLLNILFVWPTYGSVESVNPFNVNICWSSYSQSKLETSITTFTSLFSRYVDKDAALFSMPKFIQILLT